MAQKPLHILITGFEPFGGEERNPSGELAQELAAADGLPAEVRAGVLPVVLRKASAQVRASLERESPDFVLLLGLARGASVLTLERVAINLYSAGPDNEGNTFCDETILPNAPAAYFGTFPIRKILDAAKEAGIPMRESFSAGTFCCNEVFFAALDWVAERGLSIPVGFVHLPCFPEQVADRAIPSMARDVQLRGLRLILDVLLSEAMTFFELDVVQLLTDGRDIEGNLIPSGSRGTVLTCSPKTKRYFVEFADYSDEPVILGEAQVDERALRLIQRKSVRVEKQRAAVG